MTEHLIPQDTLYPRDAQHRYRLYARVGTRLTILACAPDPGGIGQALVTLHDDAKAAGSRLADSGRIGILDVLGGEDGHGDWVLLPWDRYDASGRSRA